MRSDRSVRHRHLPARALILDEFAVSASAQLTLTVFMVARGRLVVGSLSDRMGRRNLLILGSVGAALAAVVTPVHPGSGSALLGAAQFSLAALVSPLTGLAADRAHRQAVRDFDACGDGDMCATLVVLAVWAVFSRPVRAT